MEVKNKFMAEKINNLGNTERELFSHEDSEIRRNVTMPVSGTYGTGRLARSDKPNTKMMCEEMIERLLYHTLITSRQEHITQHYIQETSSEV